jgi:hypothetical protein
VVSNFVEIEIVDSVPGFERSAFPVHGVQMPINFRAVVETDVSEQIELMLAYGVGFFADDGDFVWQEFPQKSRPLVDFVSPKEEFSAGLVAECAFFRPELVPGPVCNQIEALTNFLNDTGACLIPAHSGEAL